MTLSELLASGELSGYEPGLPASPRVPVLTIDGDVAADATCEGCGHKGLTYKPFTKAGSYRAFAVCPKCDEAQEF